MDNLLLTDTQTLTRRTALHKATVLVLGTLMATTAVSQTSARPSTESTAVFAGGCFWGTQGVFQHVVGVTRALAGYTGGSAATANYKAVGTGLTGHAEAVLLNFDATQISYASLLRIFFCVAHDPTQLNRQGPDVGTQYRSAVFVGNGEQTRAATEAIAQSQRSGLYAGRIATTVEPLQGFHVAEDLHQDFMLRSPGNAHVLAHELPKLRRLKTEFPDLYREQAVRALPSSLKLRSSCAEVALKLR
jgi:peptide-methionine (S)-S-oxide reductase